MAGFLFQSITTAAQKPILAKGKKNDHSTKRKEGRHNNKNREKRKKKSTRDQQSRDLHHSTHCCTILHCPFYHSALCQPTAHRQRRLWPRPTTPTTRSADARASSLDRDLIKSHRDDKTLGAYNVYRYIYIYALSRNRAAHFHVRQSFFQQSPPPLGHASFCCAASVCAGVAWHPTASVSPSRGQVSWEASADARDIDSCLYVRSGNVTKHHCRRSCHWLISTTHHAKKNYDNDIFFFFFTTHHTICFTTHDP